MKMKVSKESLTAAGTLKVGSMNKLGVTHNGGIQSLPAQTREVLSSDVTGIIADLPLSSAQELGGAQDIAVVHVSEGEADLHGAPGDATSVAPLLWPSDGILRQALLSPGLLTFTLQGPEKTKGLVAAEDENDSHKTQQAMKGLKNHLSSGLSQELGLTIDSLKVANTSVPLPPVSEIPRPGSLPQPIPTNALEATTLLSPLSVRASSVPPATETSTKETCTQFTPSIVSSSNGTIVDVPQSVYKLASSIINPLVSVCESESLKTESLSHSSLSSLSNCSLPAKVNSPLPPISEVKPSHLMSTVSDMHMQRLNQIHNKPNNQTANITDSISIPMSMPLLPPTVNTLTGYGSNISSMNSVPHTSPLAMEILNSNVQSAILSHISRTVLPTMSSSQVSSVLSALSNSDVSASLSSDLPSDTDSLSHVDLDASLESARQTIQATHVQLQLPQKVSSETQTDSDLVGNSVKQLDRNSASARNCLNISLQDASSLCEADCNQFTPSVVSSSNGTLVDVPQSVYKLASSIINPLVSVCESEPIKTESMPQSPLPSLTMPSKVSSHRTIIEQMSLLQTPIQDPVKALKVTAPLAKKLPTFSRLSTKPSGPGTSLLASVPHYPISTHGGHGLHVNTTSTVTPSVLTQQPTLQLNEELKSSPVEAPTSSSSYVVPSFGWLEVKSYTGVVTSGTNSMPVTSVSNMNSSVVLKNNRNVLPPPAPPPLCSSVPNKQNLLSNRPSLSDNEVNDNSPKKQRRAPSKAKSSSVTKRKTVNAKVASAKGDSAQENAEMVQQVACFKCKFCPFINLSEDGVTHHIEESHKNEVTELSNAKNGSGSQKPKTVRRKLRCPGCANVFYAAKSLKVHLIQDHQVNEPVLKVILEKMNVDFKSSDVDKKPKKKPSKRNKFTDNLEVYFDECGKIKLRTIDSKKEKEKEKRNSSDRDELSSNTSDLDNGLVIDHSDSDYDDDDRPNSKYKRKRVRKKHKSDKSEDEDEADSGKNSEEDSDEESCLMSPSVKKRGRPRGSTNIGITALKKLNPSIRISDKELGYKCDVDGCAVRMKSHDNIEYHRRCHLGAFYKCPECAMSFPHWKSLNVHLWRSHVIDMELYSCDECGYKTNSWSKLVNLHKRIHSSERPYLCDVCGKDFKTSKQLRNHKGIHLDKMKQRVFKSGECEICHRNFSDKRMLRVHHDTVHNKLRPFLCNYCGYSASSRSTLKMHMRQHTGEKPFICDICDYRTADHNSLRRHKMKHSGEKPYKCPYCVYACIQSSTYKTHLKNKHPGQDDGLMFSCDLCSFRSIRKENYITHLADHQTGTIPVTTKKKPEMKKSKEEESKRDEEMPVRNTEQVVPQGPIIVNLSTTLPISTSQTMTTQGSSGDQSVQTVLPGASYMHFIYASMLDGVVQQLKVPQVQVSLSDLPGQVIHVVEQLDPEQALQVAADSPQVVQLSSSDLVTVPVSLSNITSSSVANIAVTEMEMTQETEPEQITGDVAELGVSNEPEDLKFKVSEDDIS